MNIPTPIEALKTYDNKVFNKSGDIGQILQVFLHEEDRDLMREKLCPVPNDLYYPHGLTDPTIDIVQRRFEATRINENFLTFRYQEVLTEVLDFASRSGSNVVLSSRGGSGPGTLGEGNGGGKSSKRGRKLDGDSSEGNQQNATATVPPYYETVVEEVLDFDDYMLDPAYPYQGRTIVLEGSQWTPEQIQLIAAHPEILSTKAEVEDDRLEKMAQEELKRQKHKTLMPSGSGGDANVSMTDSDPQQVASSSANTAGNSNGNSGLSLSFKLRLNRSGDAVEVDLDDPAASASLVPEAVQEQRQRGHESAGTEGHDEDPDEDDNGEEMEVDTQQQHQQQSKLMSALDVLSDDDDDDDDDEDDVDGQQHLPRAQEAGGGGDEVVVTADDEDIHDNGGEGGVDMDFGADDDEDWMRGL